MPHKSHGVVGILLGLLIQCGGDSGNGSGAEDACNLGELDCPCMGDACMPGLICQDGTCVASVCGNGMVEDPEVCDDGNNVDGDGCAADCKSLR